MSDHVLVLRDARQEMSNGVLLPRTDHDDKTTTGTVAAIGPKVVDVQQNDRVAFPKYANKQVKIGDDVFVLLKEQEIFAVIP